MNIDHVAIVVNDVDKAASHYKNILDVCEVKFETVATEGVKLAILKLNNARIELMEPINDDSPIKKFLEKNGEGLHHIALETNNINNTIQNMNNCAIKFLGNVRTGSENTKIIFIHPKSFHGVLIELCEYAK